MPSETNSLSEIFYSCLVFILRIHHHTPSAAKGQQFPVWASSHEQFCSRFTLNMPTWKFIAVTLHPNCCALVLGRLDLKNPNNTRMGPHNQCHVRHKPTSWRSNGKVEAQKLRYIDALEVLGKYRWWQARYGANIETIEDCEDENPRPRIWHHCPQYARDTHDGDTESHATAERQGRTEKQKAYWLLLLHNVCRLMGEDLKDQISVSMPRISCKPLAQRQLEVTYFAELKASKYGVRLARGPLMSNAKRANFEPTFSVHIRQ